MEPKVGTRAWALKSGGILLHRDRLRLMGQAMLARLAMLSARSGGKLRPGERGLGKQELARVNLDVVRMPDSHAALDAIELLRESSEPWLANHSFRTYVWGALLAQAGKIRFDEELFFVASLLHDIGLTEEDRCGAHCAACFAVTGARTAETFAEEAGWSGERRDRLSEAISLHLNVRVGLEQGAEAHLLQAGSALDVIGARRREVHPETVDAVLERYPRLGFKDQIGAAINEQARIYPESRAAFLLRRGFGQMIRSSSWSD